MAKARKPAKKGAETSYNFKLGSKHLLVRDIKGHIYLIDGASLENHRRVDLERSPDVKRYLDSEPKKLVGITNAYVVSSKTIFSGCG